MTEDDVPKSGRTVNSSKEEVLDIARRHGAWTGSVLAKEGWSEDRIGRFFWWLKDHPEFQKELMAKRSIKKGCDDFKKSMIPPKPKKRKFYAVVFYGFNTCKG